MENASLSNHYPQSAFAEVNNQSETPTENRPLHMDNRLQHHQRNQWQLRVQLLTEIKRELGIRTPTNGIAALREILYRVQSQRGMLRQVIEQARRQTAASSGQIRTQQTSQSVRAETPETGASYEIYYGDGTRST